LNGKLFCIDLKTGNIRWTFHTDGYKKHRSKYFQRDDVFVENIGKLLPDGEAILNMYRELGAVFSQPIVSERRLLFASNDGTIYCLGL
jgi:outer membrane protein assembly factor BamB